MCWSALRAHLCCSTVRLGELKLNNCACSDLTTTHWEGIARTNNEKNNPSAFCNNFSTNPARFQQVPVSSVFRFLAPCTREDPPLQLHFFFLAIREPLSQLRVYEYDFNFFKNNSYCRRIAMELNFRKKMMIFGESTVREYDDMTPIFGGKFCNSALVCCARAHRNLFFRRYSPTSLGG